MEAVALSDYLFFFYFLFYYLLLFYFLRQMFDMDMSMGTARTGEIIQAKDSNGFLERLSYPCVIKWLY